jgi:hypothetical protein
MAWYLVIHGSRFHFSHEFKPLLLSQIQEWYKGGNFKRRIRYQKRKRDITDLTNQTIHAPLLPTQQKKTNLQYGMKVVFITMYIDPRMEP